MWALRTFLIIVLIILVVGFAIYNSEEKVSVNLYGKEYIEVPMIFVGFWALVIGMILSLAPLPKHRTLAEARLTSSIFNKTSSLTRIPVA
jgi:hypothetical protein